jgi:transposase
MVDARTVAVGLDVHKSSVRLAAVRGGELVRELTLPFDHERVERELRAWPGARMVYEAGPTGFGLYRHLVAAGIECEVRCAGAGADESGRSGQDRQA